MKIGDSIRDQSKQRLNAAGCLVIHYGKGRYRERALALAGEACSVTLDRSLPVNPLGPGVSKGILNLLELRRELTQLGRVPPQRPTKLPQPVEHQRPETPATARHFHHPQTLNA